MSMILKFCEELQILLYRAEEIASSTKNLVGRIKSVEGEMADSHAMLLDSEIYVESTRLKISKSLGILSCMAQNIAVLTKDLVERIESLEAEIAFGEGDVFYSKNIDEESIEKLLQLNRRLADIERFLDTTKQNIQLEMMEKLDNEKNPMSDFELDLEMHYILKKSDPEWSEDCDNFLTSRKHLHFYKGNHKLESDISYCETPAHLEKLAAEPHCYLFHDLYDHDWGVGSHKLSLKDCTRVGEIWLNVTVCQQYWLDVESGRWQPSTPQEL